MPLLVRSDAWSSHAVTIACNLRVRLQSCEINVVHKVTKIDLYKSILTLSILLFLSHSLISIEINSIAEFCFRRDFVTIVKCNQDLQLCKQNTYCQPKL